MKKYTGQKAEIDKIYQETEIINKNQTIQKLQAIIKNISENETKYFNNNSIRIEMRQKSIKLGFIAILFKLAIIEKNGNFKEYDASIAGTLNDIGLTYWQEDFKGHRMNEEEKGLFIKTVNKI